VRSENHVGRRIPALKPTLIFPIKDLRLSHESKPEGMHFAAQTAYGGFAMLLTDAVHAIETVGGVWLGISAVAFILLGIFVEIRRKSAAADARRDGLAEFRDPLTHRQLDLVAKAEKRPAAKKAPARKAA
jgi:hypothetical protein